MSLGVLKAVAAHLYLAWIHPFGDGNGRTARLLEFRLLLSSGVPNVAAHLLSNHYNNTRSEYYRRLDLASREEGGPLGFVQYALQGFADNLRDQVETVKAQQLRVHWTNHVHGQIQDDTPSARRQRHLVLDLPVTSPTPVSELPSLSPRLAREYARKTPKTLRRDLDRLRTLGLIRITSQGVWPQIESMRAFLPLSTE